MKLIRSKGKVKVNEGWSRSTASNLRRTSNVLGYAVRAHSANN